jgi:2-isopropylmalate synthase
VSGSDIARKPPGDAFFTETDMTDERDLEVYDSTLRDGAQAEGVTLSLADKLAITQALDDLGISHIEGGWPASNPKDAAYFTAVQELGLRQARIVAFGATRRARLAAADDPSLRELVACGADTTAIFGKAWDLHVTEALRVTNDENLAMVQDSVAFLVAATGRPVFFDAEHFFDGYAADPAYAMAVLSMAHAAGAARLVLCDTNGGSLPEQITAAVAAVRTALPAAVLGIHTHNDGGLAVANSLAAIAAGCRQVQGTINGIGERCGNADLTTVIANCELKLGLRCLPDGNLARLSDLSRLVWERANLVPPAHQPYVGRAAFAHKGGVHASAVARCSRTYEHVEPQEVGNHRRVLISELAGRSNIRAKLQTRYPGLADDAVIGAILTEIQDREAAGFTYETADASFDLLVRRHLGRYVPAFTLLHYRIHGLGVTAELHQVEATVKLLDRRGDLRLTVAEGDGPVDALYHALADALRPSCPFLEALRLEDFKVRVVNSADGTAAKVRVLIDHRFEGTTIATVGVDENIIEASWRALADAVDSAVLMHEERPPTSR